MQDIGGQEDKLLFLQAEFPAVYMDQTASFRYIHDLTAWMPVGVHTVFGQIQCVERGDRYVWGVDFKQAHDGLPFLPIRVKFS